MGNTLALQMGISVDPTAGEAALDAFTAKVDSVGTRGNQAFNRMNAAIPPLHYSVRQLAEDGVQPLGRSLTDAEENARLLGEELGVHLPRTVTRYFGEMLPVMAEFSTALIGVFAISEIPKFIETVKDGVDAWEGFGKAEQEAMKKAIDDTAILHTKVADVEKELALFGKSQAEQAALKAKWAKEDVAAAQKDLDTGKAKVKGIQDQIAEAKKGADAFAASAGSTYEKALTAAQAQVTKLQAAWTLASDEWVLSQKRAAEAAAQQSKQEADQRANEARRQLSEQSQAQRVYHQQVRKEIAEEIQQREHGRQSERQSEQKRAAEDALALRQHERMEQMNATVAAQMARDVEQAHKAADQAVRQSSFAMQGFGDVITLEMVPAYNRWKTVIRDLTAAQDDENRTLASRTAFVSQNLADIMQELGLKREYAAFMAVYESAKGFEALGDYDFWGATQDFISAARYGIAAGSGSGARGSGSGGGGRGSRGASRFDSSWQTGGGGGQGVERGGSASGLGGGGKGGQMIVSLPSNLSSIGAQQVFAWLGVGNYVGAIKINAQGSSGRNVPMS